MLCVQESFGWEMLRTIGYIYMNKAKMFQGQKQFFGIPGLLRDFRDKAHVAKEVVSTYFAVADLSRKQEEMAAMEAQKSQSQGTSGSTTPTGTGGSGDSIGEFHQKVQEQLMAEKLLRTFWRFNKLDLENTLRQVCDWVLNDSSIPATEQQLRAEALRTLGQIFYNVPKPVSQENSNMFYDAAFGNKH
jgi:hypothetical protein